MSIWQSLWQQPAAAAGHYRLIDLLRGFAALSVLFWHYQGFFTAGATADAAPVAVVLPLAAIFGWFYRHGYLAVELFWAISGFVFAAVYVGTAVAARTFAVARFARLYPLQLLTLLIVTGLQFASLSQTGRLLAYGHFDLYHFGLNLLFVQGWGFEQGVSFNGPTWSISVELLIYAVFWLVLRPVFKRGVLGPAVLALAFMVAVAAHLPGHVWECGSFFFVGCGVYVVHRAMPPPLQLALVAAMTVIGYRLLGSQYFLALVLLIAAIILATAALEPALGRHARRLGWIGDNSYGVYLWHIPFQMVLLLVVSDRARFASPLMLGLFIGGTVVIARLSFVLFERPQRAFWRARMKPGATRAD